MRFRPPLAEPAPEREKLARASWAQRKRPARQAIRPVLCGHGIGPQSSRAGRPAQGRGVCAFTGHGTHLHGLALPAGNADAASHHLPETRRFPDDQGDILAGHADPLGGAIGEASGMSVAANPAFKPFARSGIGHECTWSTVEASAQAARAWGGSVPEGNRGAVAPLPGSPQLQQSCLSS